MVLGSLSATHIGLAWATLAANAAAGAWALAAHWAAPLRHRALWWFTVVAQALLFVQAAVGTGLLAGQGRTVGGFHTFYGFVALAAVGILFGYRSQLAPAKRYLLYGWGGLFLMGLVIRAMYLR